MSASAVATAEIYKCLDASGSFVFTDQPCNEGERRHDQEWISVQDEKRRAHEAALERGKGARKRGQVQLT
ncbi:DUF4124 domain-containing protein [Thiohalocapsa halophila]|uniref:DUF4124 domain-containing protein n=1 Tax=Thiohalocapsa halophila TaxID=69359 RepID=UPI0034DB36B2